MGTVGLPAGFSGLPSGSKASKRVTENFARNVVEEEEDDLNDYPNNENRSMH